MSNEVTGKVVAIVSDLFFSAKIGETAKQIGLDTTFINSMEDVANIVCQVQSKPVIIVLDLNHDTVDPIKAIKLMKTSTPHIAVPLIGFVRHEMSGLGNLARHAGCKVLSRNAFSKQLPKILLRELCLDNNPADDR